jgi:hypothetical protein
MIEEMLDNAGGISFQELIKEHRTEIRSQMQNIKCEIKRLMKEGGALREGISQLKWIDKDAADSYNVFKTSLRPETEEQRAIAAKVAKSLFRPLRKSFLNTKSANSRNVLWQRKRDIGIRARHLQLLFGMLRGRKYEQVEASTCGGNNKPSVLILHSLLKEFAPDINFVYLSDICDWLGAPPPFINDYEIKLDGRPFLDFFKSCKDPNKIGVPIIETTINITCDKEKPTSC